MQFTLAANAFSNLSLLFADNGVNILVKLGNKDSLISFENRFVLFIVFDTYILYKQS